MTHVAEKDQTQFSHDWFDHNIANWQAWLAPLAGKRALRALEIGSFEGRSTVWLCDNILTDDDATIHCMDLFSPHPEHGDYYRTFRLNTERFGGKVIAHAGTSFESLCRIEGQFDLVYVDGYHSAFAALCDGAMAWPRLKVGGIMIFDDYLWSPPGTSRPNIALVRKLLGRTAAHRRRIASCATETPMLGVDGLLATLSGQYKILGSGYQKAVRKTASLPSGEIGVA